MTTSKDSAEERVIAVTREGTPVTERLAQEWADEAEHGLDMSGWRRVGRPSLTGGSGKSPMLTVRVSPELLERTQARAAAEGTSASEVLREALEAHLAARRA